MADNRNHSLAMGAGLARNEPTNQHGIPMGHAEERGKQMGVPAQHVSGGNTSSFVGTVVGREGNNLFMSAESTGGGKSDTHMIPFRTAHSDASFQRNMVGKKFRVDGEDRYVGDTRSHDYSLSPYKED